ncbi:MAG: KH domain-containing protein [Calothrix sp. C42_A2020_038]|nr:KH domain-containing protein [Calothrix sp. C42_A2020_038]
MSWKRSVQNPHHNVAINPRKSMPDYVDIVRYLVEPFLESPESLSIDCEVSTNRNRAWIRVAFDSADKGKVFGRGGRNIQAIRTCLTAFAELTGQSVYLDIFGSASGGRDGMSFDEDNEERLPPPRSRDRRSSTSSNNGHRPFIKPRSRQV